MMMTNGHDNGPTGNLYQSETGLHVTIMSNDYYFPIHDIDGHQVGTVRRPRMLPRNQPWEAFDASGHRLVAHRLEGIAVRRALFLLEAARKRS